MKKKSVIWSVMTIMMVTILCAVFAACSKSDSEQQGTNALIGTWVGTDGNDNLTIVIETANSGRWSEYNNYGGHGKTTSGRLTYQMTGNDRGTVTIIFEDSSSGTQTDTFYFIIQGSALYVYEHGYGDDLEWVLYKQ